ncbi:HAMP domain-containing histidine kinase [Vibrio sp. T187]|uniref:sensor histidine kinase n=1 Tax=Vibrio TaxID=662 RepID=UPI0010CA10D9|nr:MULTISPECIES: sensor histidine kinase [Vibrio]MBW3694567.1 HAMP domain-containing histidine kinase [Vibrio sp. T187]
MNLFTKWFNSLNGRLVFFWLVGSLVPVALLGGSTAFISAYYVQEQATRFARDLVQEKAQSVINLQKPVVSVSNHIASDSNMLDALFESSSHSAINEIRINALIEDNLAHYFSLDGLTAISLILNDGRSYSLSIEVEVNSINPTLFQSQVDRCPNLAGNQICWPGIQSNINQSSRHTLVIPAVRKIYRLNETSMEDEHVGYIYMAFSPLAYQSMLEQESDDKMPLMVLDNTNRVVFSDDYTMAGQSVDPSLLPPVDDSPYSASMDGESYFLVSHSSNISNWRFIVMIPEKQIFQGMYQTLSIAGGLVLLSLIVILFAWINMRRRVLLPLQSLSIAMQDNEPSVSGYQGKFELKEIRELIYWYNKYVEIVKHRDQQAVQLREAYEDLQRTQDQLIESEKMAALGKLVAGVAHEINTPLGISLTSLTFTKEQLNELENLFTNNAMTRADFEQFIETNKQGIEMSLNNLNRVSKLVKTFKTVATDQHIEEPQAFSFNEYIENTVLSLQPKLKQKNVLIEWHCDDEIMLHNYPGVLWQVFSNLVMNSLIHGYAEAHSGTISIVTTLKDNDVIIVYKDDGCGMGNEEKDNIFLPFYTTKREAGGTGLGMHIVYNLITQKLNGTISCVSEVDVGTEFTITLPQRIENRV